MLAHESHQGGPSVRPSVSQSVNQPVRPSDIANNSRPGLTTRKSSRHIAGVTHLGALRVKLSPTNVTLVTIRFHDLAA